MSFSVSGVTNEMLSSTLYLLKESEIDTLYKKVPFLDHAERAGERGLESLDGGTKIVRPLAIKEHSSMTEHASGYELMNMGVQDVLDGAEYQWADYSAPIVISVKEESENSGKAAVIKLAQVRLRSVMGMFRREFNKRIIAGAANQSVITRLNTLNGEYESDGFLENHAHGTGGGQTNTVGGLAKATLDVDGWYNNRETAASSFSTAGVRLMKKLLSTCNQRAVSGEIELILMSQDGFANLNRQVFTNERYLSEKDLNAGRLSMMFGAAVVEPDFDMPTNAGVGTDEFTAYFLNWDGIKLVKHKDLWFAMSPVVDVPGTTVKASRIYTKLQLIADHLGSCGVFVDGDTWS